MQNTNNQNLYWSLSRPLRYLGLTLDEWAVTSITVLPGIIIAQTQAKLGLSLIGGGVFVCYSFKKFKKMSANFILKSFLIGKGYLPAPRNVVKFKSRKLGK